MAQENSNGMRKRKDTGIAIIIIIAGLLTGGVLTWAYLRPEKEERYTPEYRVAESQRVPFGSQDTPSATGADQDAPAAEQVDDGTEEAAPADGSQADPVSKPSAESAADEEASEEAPAEAAETGEGVDPTESTASDRKTIDETRQRMEAQGVDEYAELTEELYIRVSAKMVVMASVLSKSADEDADPSRIQGLLADNAAEVLAKHRVDPEEFWAFTRDIRSDPEGAKEMGERIIREAEKHTRHEITVENVPGMSPTPLPDSGG